MSHADQDRKRQQIPPPPPYKPSQQQQAGGGYAATSASYPSQPVSAYKYGAAAQSNPSYAAASTFSNPYYVSQPASETSNYSQYAASQSADQVSVGTSASDSGISKRPSITQTYPQYATSYNTQEQNYSSSFGQSKTNDTVLKSRSVASSYSTSSQSYPTPAQNYMLSTAKNSSITASDRNKGKNNNGAIALLLLPPLALLLIFEISTSLPLLLFLCIALIVYAIDLANPGDYGGRRGYYTLCAVWGGWVVMSMVVGYDLVVLDGNYSYRSVDGVSDQVEEGGSGRGLGNVLVVLALAGQLMVSVLLLFCMATWTTLQFQWLPNQIPHIAHLLERILHFTLPPTSAAIVAYKLTSTSMASSNVTWGVDSLATLFPYLFAFNLALGIWLVGAAPSTMGSDGGDTKSEDTTTYSKEYKKDSREKVATFYCAIQPREGRLLSNLLVFAPSLIHIATFRQRIIYSHASWDDLFDLVLISTVPYLLHYLLASKGVLDERWRRSLNWFLKAGTSQLEDGRTIRGAAVPMVLSLLACVAFQQRYLISLCAWASYIMNGHEGVISSVMATTFLTLGTLLMYTSFWFFQRQHEDGSYLLGEYHEDVFQLLLGAASICLGLSTSPPWSFLPVPMLLAESLALWIISKQLRYSALTIFVFFTCASLMIAYRLTFLSETVEILPNKRIRLKQFAQYAMLECMLAIFFVGLVHRASGGVFEKKMKKWDATGICLTIYSLFLVILEFALLRAPMPVYSRDNFEVGKVAVYSPSTAYLTGLLTLVISWHLSRQHITGVPCTILTTSISISKMLAVLIEENLLDGDDSLKMIYIRFIVTTTLLVTVTAPHIMSPVHLKMSVHAKRGPSGKPSDVPKSASMKVALYCAVILPLVILMSVRLVIEPIVGILIGYGSSAFYYASPKFSEVIGYSCAIWGLAMLHMINHFLPDGGADTMRRFSALIFVMGLFVSFSAPAIPCSTADEDSMYSTVSSIDQDDSSSSGGWGLVSAFLAILLAITGPLELREVRDASGRRDTRQLLRLMIFGTMLGCGLAWFITMQSMNKDIFIPIFVTAFSTMAMSFLGTVASVMGYFLEVQDFSEAEQIANVWAGIGFPIFFFISSVSLSAHAHPFGIGGWASTYLSVCGVLAGAFTILIRMRDEKNSTTRGYSNASCVISWLCAISVIYGRYGVAGVGVVGTTSIAGIHMSVLGTLFCAPILLLLEGEPSDGNKRQYQTSARSTKKGLVLNSLTRSNWFAPLLLGTVSTFLTATVYAIFVRGCGLSKFSLLFGAVEDVEGQSMRSNARLDEVALLAKNSIVHTKTMISAARLNESGVWTAKSISGPMLHIIGLLMITPGLRNLLQYSWSGTKSQASKVTLVLLLSILSMLIGNGIPSLVAAAIISFVGGLMMLSSGK